MSNSLADLARFAAQLAGASPASLNLTTLQNPDAPHVREAQKNADHA